MCVLYMCSFMSMKILIDCLGCDCNVGQTAGRSEGQVCVTDKSNADITSDIRIQSMCYISRTRMTSA